MQKEKILSELYHGNLTPVAKSVVPGSEFQKGFRENGIILMASYG